MGTAGMSKILLAMGVFCFLLPSPWFDGVHAGKEKQTTKKRPVAVTNPYAIKSLEEWINLGKTVLEKSCTAANLPVSGSIVTMARRLWRFYQQSTVTNVVVPENADGSLIPRLRPLPSGPSTSSATVTSRTSVNIIPDQDDGESNLVTEPGLQSAFDERDYVITGTMLCLAD